MNIGKTTALTTQNFVGKVSAFYYLVYVGHNCFSKEQASFNFMAEVPCAVILEPRKITFVTVSTVSISICHEVMGPDAIILVF